MKTKKTSMPEPVVANDASTSPKTSLRISGLSIEESEKRWAHFEKVFENAEPAEILEKPVQLRDGRWLTAEEVVEYAKTLGESA